jgi:hypothetical protein
MRRPNPCRRHQDRHPNRPISQSHHPAISTLNPIRFWIVAPLPHRHRRRLGVVRSRESRAFRQRGLNRVLANGYQGFGRPLHSPLTPSNHHCQPLTGWVVSLGDMVLLFLTPPRWKVLPATRRPSPRVRIRGRDQLRGRLNSPVTRNVLLCCPATAPLASGRRRRRGRPHRGMGIPRWRR